MEARSAGAGRALSRRERGKTYGKSANLDGRANDRHVANGTTNGSDTNVSGMVFMERLRACIGA
jgi:hypothetical protein